MASTQNTANMHSEAIAELELRKGFASPKRIYRYYKLRDMDITIKEMTLKEWTTFATNLCFNIARTKVLHKESLKAYATMF